MKRSGFRFKGVEFDLPPKGAKAPRVHSLATPQRGKIRLIAAAVALVTQRPKERPRRSKKYRAWVAGQDCMHCGLVGFSQAAHGDEGKGERIKACDSTCWPACADRPMQIGCHALFGATGLLGKDSRRELEKAYAERTRERAIAEGVYPAGWPR